MTAGSIFLYETDGGSVEVSAEDYASQLGAYLLGAERRDALAAGREFDPDDSAVRARIDEALVTALDEMGLILPDDYNFKSAAPATTPR